MYLALVLYALSVAAGAVVGARPAAVKLVADAGARRVEVVADGKAFAVYRSTGDPAKPVVWPILTAGGHAVTRGFPIEPQPGDPTDHPHHVGLWFNHGDVDGVDFWGNSAAARAEQPARRFGNIVERSSKARASEIAAVSDWLAPDGQPILHEETRYRFAAGPGRRVIDRIATLTATRVVPFGDTKEGSLGLRLTPALEHPSKKNPDATGHYLSSEGVEGEAVWGTRARWMLLTGRLGDEDVTVAILDHPKNPGHPVSFHARGYGLFAANPFGRKEFSGGKEAASFALQPGKPARFAYRLLILSRKAVPADIEADWRRFAQEVK